MTIVLMHDAACERVIERASAIDPSIDIVRMDADGKLWRGDNEINAETLALDAAWFSFDFYMTGTAAAFGETLKQAQSTKWMQTCNAGLDHPLYQDLFDQVDRLSNSDAQAISIAEYVVGSVLYHFTRIEERKAAQSEHHWRYMPFREIYGSTWLIVGFGHIGQLVAERVKAFGARVVGVRRQPMPNQLADAMTTAEGMSKFLGEADVVVLACPLNDETRGMCDAQFFASMKEKSVLVNIARGAVISEQDLLSGLEKGRPGYAVLDVFEKEPLPKESPIWDHPNILVSAHSSNAGEGLLSRGDDLFLENFRNFKSSRPLRNDVDLSQFRK